GRGGNRRGGGRRRRGRREGGGRGGNRRGGSRRRRGRREGGGRGGRRRRGGRGGGGRRGGGRGGGGGLWRGGGGWGGRRGGAGGGLGEGPAGVRARGSDRGTRRTRRMIVPWRNRADLDGLGREDIESHWCWRQGPEPQEHSQHEDVTRHRGHHAGSELGRTT